jgi:hypothetical protein
VPSRYERGLGLHTAQPCCGSLSSMPLLDSTGSHDLVLIVLILAQRPTCVGAPKYIVHESTRVMNYYEFSLSSRRTTALLKSRGPSIRGRCTKNHPYRWDEKAKETRCAVDLVVQHNELGIQLLRVPGRSSSGHAVPAPNHRLCPGLGAGCLYSLNFR